MKAYNGEYLIRLYFNKSLKFPEFCDLQETIAKIKNCEILE